MTIESLLFFVLIFLVWAVIAAAAAWLLLPDRFRRRVASIEGEATPSLTAIHNPWIERVLKIAKPLAKLSRPDEGWEQSPIRIRFMNAGWRNPSAPQLFFGTKTLLAFVLPLIVLLVGGEALFSAGPQMVILSLIAASCVGYYLPNMVLNHLIEKRQREVFENFPDALDLLIICVEAGLGLDAAIAKVAAEIHLKSEVLAEELQLVLLELRAGFTKERALRNLSLRTGVEDIDMLVAMLIQSDRFGTSMGDSLRVHAENLRTKRRQRAEEAAAKISLKLLFPLIFFIFPTLMVVLVGPAAMQVYRNLLPVMASE